MSWYQGCQAPSLERALGFAHGKQYQRVGRRLHSALAVRSVVEGGILANAGFQSDDVLPEWSATEFFRHLHRNRGAVVELEVVDGDPEGPAFQTRPRRTLRFAVPGASESRATWRDLLQGVSVWFPFVLMAAGAAIGVLVVQATLPSGPLWAQVVIVFLLAGAGMHVGVWAVVSRGERGAGR